jgi:hypothetical protein
LQFCATLKVFSNLITENTLGLKKNEIYYGLSNLLT